MNEKERTAAGINSKGEFVRKALSFREWITADGSSGYKAESGRYHLYVSLACPWAHRTLIVRKLKGLEEVITVDVVDWHMTSTGWHFNKDTPGCTDDTVNGKKLLKEIYFKAKPDYDGRYTVPVLWDKKQNKIVSNESSEIIRMLNSQFNEFCKTEKQKKLDLYPEHLRKDIDALNDWIYPQINNGVYRAGAATNQDPYDTAVREVFNGLDRCEEILENKRYLTGSQFTEADIRLFTTLIRFDPVYVGHFKCNKKRIIDYPNLWAYTRDILHIPVVKDTVDQEHIQKHYQVSHTSINPCSIVAIGPDLDYEAPHDRERLSQ